MFVSIKLDDDINCKKLCETIQKNLFNKFIKEKISLKNKQLVITIKDTIEHTDTISTKSNQKMLF